MCARRPGAVPGADGPDARLGYAYVMNKTGFHLLDDPREKALRDAIYRAIARRTTGSGATRRPAEARAL